MVKKYVYGNPIPTDAIVLSYQEEQAPISHVTIDATNAFTLQYTMKDQDIIYGLGEANRGINKRGYIYKSNCTDIPSHTEDKESLYGAHNFLLIKSDITFGLFFDYPGNITFDVGCTLSNLLLVHTSDANLSLYMITGDSLIDVVTQFRKMIGTSYIPPYYAFGYGQSRWGYRNADDVRKVADKYKENDLPLDSIYLDIDYMVDYKDFTVDESKFPNFKQFVEEMKKRGIHLIPIIDAGVKIEEGYSIYEEGKDNNYFCKREDGTDFVAGVWPGRTHFPDFLNSDARAWFGSKYSFLIEQGIDGFWNDMNEPAIFYSEEGLNEVLQELSEFQDDNPGMDAFFHLKDTVNSLNNNEKDYKRFYHNREGQKIRHDLIHNLYGYYMTRAASEAFDQIEKEKRFLLFSRSSYVGMHRYGGIWTGDNCAWWSHLLLNIKMMPSLNMCGFLFSGADLGGFGGHTTRDLLLRWLAFGIFTPLMRNHSAHNTREQECYQFEQIEDFREILRLRYRLLPYLYSEYIKAATMDGMLFRPLSFDYEEDITAAHIEDQLLLGEALMLAPIYEQNAIGRHVYLPEDMLYIKFTTANTYEHCILTKGHHYIYVTLAQVPIFLRKNHLLPLSNVANSTNQLSTNFLTILGFVDRDTSYILYEDNGYEKDYHNKSHYHNISVTSYNEEYIVTSTDPLKILSSNIIDANL